MKAVLADLEESTGRDLLNDFAREESRPMRAPHIDLEVDARAWQELIAEAKAILAAMPGRIIAKRLAADHRFYSSLSLRARCRRIVSSRWVAA